MKRKIDPIKDDSDKEDKRFEEYKKKLIKSLGPDTNDSANPEYEYLGYEEHPEPSYRYDSNLPASFFLDMPTPEPADGFDWTLLEIETDAAYVPRYPLTNSDLLLPIIGDSSASLTFHTK